MKEMRFAIFGTRFWSRFQLAAWNELAGVRCVSLYNRTRSKAEALAQGFGVSTVYDDAAELLKREKVDFVDIITDVDTHVALALLAAKHGLPVICQKPLAPTLELARALVQTCSQAGVPLLVHENWRFQTALRALNDVLQAGTIGEPYRARLDMRSGFPVTQNQPFLATVEKFIICDVGSHTLDTARWLFGEPASVFAHITRVQPHLKGEDVATIFLRYPRLSCTVNMSYASNYYEHDRFPETFVFVEGSKGTAEVGPDFSLRVTTSAGTLVRRVPPPHYAWADPRYAVIHSSIVPCHAQFVRQLRGEGPAETTGEDNLRTIKLVYASYDSAATGQAVTLR